MSNNVHSRDARVQAALQSVRLTTEAQRGLSPTARAQDVERQLRQQGINAVARVESDGSIAVRRVITG